jgi:hypothetical protein
MTWVTFTISRKMLCVLTHQTVYVVPDPPERVVVVLHSLKLLLAAAHVLYVRNLRGVCRGRPLPLQRRKTSLLAKHSETAVFLLKVMARKGVYRKGTGSVKCN